MRGAKAMSGGPTGLCRTKLVRHGPQQTSRDHWRESHADGVAHLPVEGESARHARRSYGGRPHHAQRAGRDLSAVRRGCQHTSRQRRGQVGRSRKRTSIMLSSPASHDEMGPAGSGWRHSSSSAVPEGFQRRDAPPSWSRGILLRTVTSLLRTVTTDSPSSPDLDRRDRTFTLFGQNLHTLRTEPAPKFSKLKSQNRISFLSPFSGT
jgi:hypothetical protein